MKYLIYIITLLSITFAANAQYDSTAQKHLDNLAKSIEKDQGIEITFNVKVNRVNEEKPTNEEKGKLWIKNDSHKLELGETVTYNDGTNEWIYMSDMDEVTIQPVDEDQITPASIFTIYKEGYKFRTIDEDDKKVIVELSPEDKASPYIRITLFINKKTKQLDTFSLQSKNGYITSINITAWNNSGFNDSLLLFNKGQHPEAEVIDLR